MVSADCTRMLLYVFNFIFWLGGAVLLGFGLWMWVDPTIMKYLHVTNLHNTDPLITYAGLIFMVAGGLAILVGILGCLGARRDSQPLLFIYMVLLFLIMCGEIVGGVLALLYRSKVESGLADSMANQIRMDYSKVETRDAWDFLQEQHMCCGGNNYTDYKDSDWWNNTRPFVNTTAFKEWVPKSCCKPGPENYIPCQRDARKDAPESEYLYREGCHDALQSWFQQHSLVMMILGLGIGGAQIFAFIAACCLRVALKDKAFTNS